jgi:hypothetical protein
MGPQPLQVLPISLRDCRQASWTSRPKQTKTTLSMEGSASRKWEVAGAHAAAVDETVCGPQLLGETDIGRSVFFQVVALEQEEPARVGRAPLPPRT